MAHREEGSKRKQEDAQRRERKVHKRDRDAIVSTASAEDLRRLGWSMTPRNSTTSRRH